MKLMCYGESLALEAGAHDYCACQSCRETFPGGELVYLPDNRKVCQGCLDDAKPAAEDYFGNYPLRIRRIDGEKTPPYSSSPCLGFNLSSSALPTGNAQWDFAAAIIEGTSAALFWPVWRWSNKRTTGQVKKWRKDVKWIPPIVLVLAFLVSSCFIAPYHFWKDERDKFVALQSLFDSEAPHFVEGNSGLDLLHPPGSTADDALWMATGIHVEKKGKHPARNCSYTLVGVPQDFIGGPMIGPGIQRFADDIELGLDMRAIPKKPYMVKQLPPFFILCQMMYTDGNAGASANPIKQSFYKKWGTTVGFAKTNMLDGMNVTEKNALIAWLKTHNIELLFPPE